MKTTMRSFRASAECLREPGTAGLSLHVSTGGVVRVDGLVLAGRHAHWETGQRGKGRKTERERWTNSTGASSLHLFTLMQIGLPWSKMCKPTGNVCFLAECIHALLLVAAVPAPPGSKSWKFEINVFSSDIKADNLALGHELIKTRCWHVISSQHGSKSESDPTNYINTPESMMHFPKFCSDCQN